MQSRLDELISKSKSERLPRSEMKEMRSLKKLKSAYVLAMKDVTIEEKKQETAQEEAETRRKDETIRQQIADINDWLDSVNYTLPR